MSEDPKIEQLESCPAGEAAMDARIERDRAEGEFQARLIAMRSWLRNRFSLGDEMDASDGDLVRGVEEQLQSIAAELGASGGLYMNIATLRGAVGDLAKSERATRNALASSNSALVRVAEELGFGNEWLDDVLVESARKAAAAVKELAGTRAELERTKEVLVREQNAAEEFEAAIATMLDAGEATCRGDLLAALKSKLAVSELRGERQDNALAALGQLRRGLAQRLGPDADEACTDSELLAVLGGKLNELRRIGTAYDDMRRTLVSIVNSAQPSGFKTPDSLVELKTDAEIILAITNLVATLQDTGRIAQERVRSEVGIRSGLSRRLDRLRSEISKVTGGSPHPPAATEDEFLIRQLEGLHRDKVVAEGLLAEARGHLVDANVFRQNVAVTLGCASGTSEDGIIAAALKAAERNRRDPEDMVVVAKLRRQVDDLNGKYIGALECLAHSRIVVAESGDRILVRVPDDCSDDFLERLDGALGDGRRIIGLRGAMEMIVVRQGAKVRLTGDAGQPKATKKPVPAGKLHSDNPFTDTRLESLVLKAIGELDGPVRGSAVHDYVRCGGIITDYVNVAQAIQRHVAGGRVVEVDDNGVSAYRLYRGGES